MSGSGECRCHAHFTGTACELCAPGAFGPLCQGRLCCPALPCSLTPVACVPTPSCLSLSPACNCTSHGRCDEGLGGSGSCFCDEGWTGPHCEVQLGEWALCLCPPCTHQCVPQLHTRMEGSPGGQPLTWMCGVGPGGQSCSLCALHPAHPRPCAALATAVSAAWATKGTAAHAQVSRGGGPTPLPPPTVPWPNALLPPPVVDLCQDGRGGCSEHANCSQVGTAVTCTCWPDYEGDGWSCRARNPCEDGHRGGCSEHADCLNTGPVSMGSRATGWGPPGFGCPRP